jgi:hypothetical protein
VIRSCERSVIEDRGPTKKYATRFLSTIVPTESYAASRAGKRASAFRDLLIVFMHPSAVTRTMAV